MGGLYTTVLAFHVISTVTWNPDYQFGLLNIKNCKFSPLPFKCQSTLTTEPGPQRNQRFDFPLAAELNHRLQHRSAVASPSPADGPVTAKYSSPCIPISLILIGWLGAV